MTIDVIDFYKNSKLNIHPKFNKSLSDGDIIILGDFNGHKKEIAVHIPKKYCFKRFCVRSAYETRKALEFAMLTDYLSEIKESFKEKNNLSEADFQELALGLKCVLNDRYTTCKGIKKFKLKCGSQWELFCYRLKRIWSE